MTLVASDDKLRNMSWKVFFEGWILVLRATCLGVSKFSGSREDGGGWNSSSSSASGRKAEPVFGWVGLICLWHCFIILLLYLFFDSATPMGDVPRRLNECQVVTSRQAYSISIKITWQEREKQLCSTHPWTLLCYSRLAHVLQLRGKIHEAPEKLPGILGVRIWCVACTWFPASKEIE